MVDLAVLIFTPWTGWRGHPEWWGWRHSDLFFPMFLFVAGAGLALQTKRGVPWPRLLRRFVALVLIGLFVNAVLGSGLDLSRLRLPGVLQRIAIVGLAGATIVVACRRRWPAVAGVAVALSLLWGFALVAGARDCPGGVPTKEGCGTYFWLDERAFGSSHVYGEGTAGHDPEGLASTLGALATFLAGFAAAGCTWQLRNRSTGTRVGALVAMAAAWVALTPLMLAFAPFGKRLWTPAFVSLNAAGSLAVLVVLTLVFDTPSRWRVLDIARRVVAWPFEAVGRNALLAWTTLYFIEQALSATFHGQTTLGEHLLVSNGQVGYLLVTLGGWMTVWSLMHVARWHIRL